MRAKDFITEAFDQPYQLKWEKGDHGDIDAIAKLDDGNYLSIMFNKESNEDNEEAWVVEFYRNNSQEVTGEGDAQRVFATVLSAIQTFIKKYKPSRVIFSASKEVEPGQNAQSRARLYDSLVQRYARAWGFRAFRADTGNKVIYELNRITPAVAEVRKKKKKKSSRSLRGYFFPGYAYYGTGDSGEGGGNGGGESTNRGVAENFADGKKPGRKGLAKRVGVNCKQSVSKLRSIAKNSSGEKQRMAHWCANMKSGKSK